MSEHIWKRTNFALPKHYVCEVCGVIKEQYWYKAGHCGDRSGFRYRRPNGRLYTRKPKCKPKKKKG